ncbi:MAG: aminopeptidase [bacterium]
MPDIRIERMADTIARHSLALRAGDYLLIQSEPAGLPLVREVYRRAVAVGANPVVRTRLPELEEILFRDGNDAQLGFIPEPSRVEIELVTARLVVRAEDNLRALSGVPPDRLALARRAQRPLFERSMERKGRGELRTCITQFPTAAAAQEAGMSLPDYEDFVFAACFCDRADPVAAWLELSRAQQVFVDFLNTIKTLRYEAPGFELELSVEGRKWINSDGKANFPSGEVFSAPVEDSASGRVRFDVPGSQSGRRVTGVTLDFEAGRVVKATAEQGEDVLNALLDTDPGARLLGEVAFGLNYGITRPTGNILFDEKIGGTIHIALGAGYPECGSANKSGIHWDLIRSMNPGQIWADGRLVYENGRFKMEALNG